MAIPPLLWLALSLLVANGLVALYLAELLGPLGAGVVALGVAASWVAGTRARPPVRPLLTGLVLPAGAAASALDVLVLAPSILDGFVRFLLFIVVYRLWTLRSVRETRTVSVMAFLMLTAASSSFFGVGFLFAFVVFVILATWLTMLQQVLIDAEPGPGRTVIGVEEAQGAGRALLGLAVAASLAIIAISAVWFFVIPRVMLAALPFRTRAGPMVTGFSDRVELGSYGEIESDSAVIMRVHIADWMPEPDRLPNLRWRGVVLDHFDGRVWTIRQPRRIWPRRVVEGDVPVALLRGTGRILVQEFYLEPLGTDVIFVAPRPVRLRVRAAQVNQDDMDSLMVPAATARLNYVVASELDEGVAARPWVRPAPPLDEAAMARYLQLPPIAPRVEALARDVTAGSQDPQEAAQRLAAFLSREYRYTLALERRTTLDPVEEFLFVRRSGNCEYFAAAMAVMLRSLGIPARVVNGFQRGEWNPYGRYFMVRLADAHSWVEAHVGRAGWITLDPSPRVPAGAGGGLGTLGLHLDALRVRWHRYIVNWSLRDQLETAMALRQHATSAWGKGGPWLASLRDVDPGPVARAVAVLGVLLGGLVVWRWRRVASRRPAAGKPLPLFYARALQSLARSGLTPTPGETAREFWVRVAERAPGCGGPLGTLTAAYERGRFGARALEPEDLTELNACLRALDRVRPRR
jgi:transglutaminase-like putative cysteine protease